jgi:hypothetical protein
VPQPPGRARCIVAFGADWLDAGLVRRPSATTERDHRARPALRYRERLLLVFFGLFVASVASQSSWGTVVRVAGWCIVAAAIGLVELTMALYYRLRRVLQRHST